MTPPERQIIGTYEAAQYLGCSQQTIRRLCRNGALSFYTLPNGKKKWLCADEIARLRQHLRQRAQRAQQTADTLAELKNHLIQ